MYMDKRDDYKQTIMNMETVQRGSVFPAGTDAENLCADDTVLAKTI